MKYFVCGIKGLMSSEQCFNCFTAKPKDNRPASRVLCKKQFLVSVSCFAEKFGKPEAGCDKCVSAEVRKLCEEKTAELAAAAMVQAENSAVALMPGGNGNGGGVRKKGGRADVILELLKDGGKTQQELAKLMDIKVSTAWVALKAMQNKKLIAREKKNAGGKKVQFVYVIAGNY